ncbi:PREDICTED: lipocalin-1-like [Chinchilla lanigera]|uniref:lipocalin-1-like n=1 Tax=Chinchilla lanigera TaxID=34839 RepID=UPI00069623C2|nr:PREDICTED: lipocalin-1-like [Chinchilla lanigera]
MGTLLLLLLAMGLSLLSVQGAKRPLMTPAGAEELLGTWHIIRWAGDLPMPAKTQTQPLPPLRFIRNKDTTFKLRMNFRFRSVCLPFDMHMDEFIIPGAFYSAKGYFISIHFLPGKEYAISFYKGTTAYVYYESMELIGSTLDESPDVLRTFEEYVEWKGHHKTEIIDPPELEPCEYHREV